MIVVRYLLSVLPFWLFVAAIVLGWIYRDDVIHWVKSGEAAFNDEKVQQEPVQTAAVQSGYDGYQVAPSAQPAYQGQSVPQQNHMPAPAYMAPMVQPRAAPAPYQYNDVSGQGSRSELKPVESVQLNAEQRNQLIQARESFWMRDIDASIKQYKLLTDDVSNSPDILGELGNVYLMAGDAQQAAESYVAAAELLMGTQRQMMIWQLMAVIEREMPDKAQSLRDRLMNNARG